ncbi:MAG: metallophosphoesterase [Clostridiales bacterium]|nr:metallophosphoesterase [Clostridiales bacterium]
MVIFKKLIAFFTFLTLLISGSVTFGVNPSTTKDTGDTILFFSDYQGGERETVLPAILEKVPEEPGLVVCGGDYQTLMGIAMVSSFGIYSIKETVQQRWNNSSIPFIFVQGNHDFGFAKGLSKKGLYEFDEYYIYNIPMNNFPWSQGLVPTTKKTVQKTAEELDGVLAGLVKNEDKKPVFIVTHVPLHATDRKSGKDNCYAVYLFDVINKYGKDLDIVFMFGHNHSGDYDDYIGGSVVLLQKGEKLSVAGKDAEETLSFTYSDFGYVGYSKNTLSDTSTNVLTASLVTIDDDSIDLQRYSADGAYYDAPIEIALDH